MRLAFHELSPGAGAGAGAGAMGAACARVAPGAASAGADSCAAEAAVAEATARVSAAADEHVMSGEWQRFVRAPSETGPLYDMFRYYKARDGARIGLLSALLEQAAQFPQWEQGLTYLDACRETVRMLLSSLELFPPQTMPSHVQALVLYALDRGCAGGCGGLPLRRLACLCEMLWGGRVGQRMVHLEHVLGALCARFHAAPAAAIDAPAPAAARGGAAVRGCALRCATFLLAESPGMQQQRLAFLEAARTAPPRDESLASDARARDAARAARAARHGALDAAALMDEAGWAYDDGHAVSQVAMAEAAADPNAYAGGGLAPTLYSSLCVRILPSLDLLLHTLLRLATAGGAAGGTATAAGAPPAAAAPLPKGSAGAPYAARARQLCVLYAPLYRRHPSRYTLTLSLLSSLPPHAAAAAKIAAAAAATPQLRLLLLGLVSPPLLAASPSGAGAPCARRWWCVTGAFRAYADAVAGTARWRAAEWAFTQAAAQQAAVVSEERAAAASKLWAAAPPPDEMAAAAELSAAEAAGSQQAGAPLEEQAAMAWAAAESATEAAEAPPPPSPWAATAEPVAEPEVASGGGTIAALPMTLDCAAGTVAYARELLHALVARLGAAALDASVGVPEVCTELPGAAQRVLSRARCELLCVPRGAAHLGEALAAGVLTFDRAAPPSDADGAAGAAAALTARGDGAELHAAAAAAGWLASRSTVPFRAALLGCATRALCTALRLAAPLSGSGHGGHDGHGGHGGHGGVPAPMDDGPPTCAPAAAAAPGAAASGVATPRDGVVVEAAISLLCGLWAASTTTHAAAECAGVLSDLAELAAATAGAPPVRGAGLPSPLLAAVRCAAPLCERLRAEACGEAPSRVGESEHNRDRAVVAAAAATAAGGGGGATAATAAVARCTAVAAERQLVLIEQLQRMRQQPGALVAEPATEALLTDLLEHLGRFERK